MARLDAPGARRPDPRLGRGRPPVPRHLPRPAAPVRGQRRGWRRDARPRARPDDPPRAGADPAPHRLEPGRPPPRPPGLRRDPRRGRLVFRPLVRRPAGADSVRLDRGRDEPRRTVRQCGRPRATGSASSSTRSGAGRTACASSPTWSPRRRVARTPPAARRRSRAQLPAWWPADAPPSGHPLPRRRGRPRRQGDPLRRPRRRGRSARAWPSATWRRAPTRSSSSTSRPHPRAEGRSSRSWSAPPARPSSRSRSAAASARVDEMRAVLRAGADKVALNTAAVGDPAWSMPARRPSAPRPSSWPSTRAGARPTRRSDVATGLGGRRPGRPRGDRPGCGGRGPGAVAQGAGELLVTSIDRDGTQAGFDVELLRAIRHGSGCRSSPRAGRPARRTSWPPSGTAARTRSSPPASSTGGTTRSARSRRRWPRPDSPVRAVATAPRHERPRDRREPPRAPAYGPDGLVPVIVQDAADGRVLMLAWTDAEALAATIAPGEVHFHSRSRDRLWRKGETSGNVLRLRDLALDCDGDALLLTVDPAGPTCHRGTRSCFDLEPAATELGPRPDTAGTRQHQGFAWLETLWATIASRALDRPAGLVHGQPPRRRRRRGRPQGDRGGDRGPHGGQGRRRGRGRRDRSERDSRSPRRRDRRPPLPRPRAARRAGPPAGRGHRRAPAAAPPAGLALGETILRRLRPARRSSHVAADRVAGPDRPARRPARR